MSTAMITIASGETVKPFPSLSALRRAHGDLLKGQTETGSLPDSLAAVNDFVERGQATGALLDSADDRWSAQSALDYWASVLYRSGRGDLDPALVEFDPKVAPVLDDALCPYVGLEAFREGQSELFFGRARLIEEMANRLAATRLLAVLGPSGSGKSSLVLGGLLPALAAGALPGSASWHYARPLVPGSDPLTNLLRALLPAEAQLEKWLAEQAEKLTKNPESLSHLAAQVSAGKPLVLVVDQFEEVFTLCGEDRSHAFIASLLSLLKTPEPRHVVILTLRSDYEPHVARLQELQALWAEAQLRVTPLGAGELRDAIERPARRIGLKFEEGVVPALLNDILGEPAGLPLLQFTLLKLWERRERNRVTLAAYRQLGGGRLALARSADELYESLIPEEQVTARRILLRMVRPGDGLEVTSNRIQKESLYRLGEDPGRVDRVVEKLVKARLVRLTPGQTPADAQIEVAHEALVRNWPKLVDWLEELRAKITIRRRLEARAAEWVRLGRGRGGLLDKVQLAEAEGWLASPEAQELGYNEQLTALVEASRAAIGRTARVRRWRTFLLGVLLLLPVAVGLAWIALDLQSQLVAKAAENDQQLKKFEKERRDLQREKQDLLQQKDQLAANIQQARDELTRARSELTSAGKEKTRARKALDAAIRKANEALQKATDADTATQFAQNLAAQLDAQAAAARSVADAAREELTKAQHEAEDLRQRSTETKQRVEALETALDTKRTTVETRVRHIEENLADGGAVREESVQKQVSRAFDTVKRKFELYQFRRAHRPLRAGISTSAQAKKPLPGTLCCMVSDAAGTYVLSRATVFSGRGEPLSPGTRILQPSFSDDPAGEARNIIATVVRAGGGNQNRAAAIARVDPKIPVENTILGRWKIAGVAAGVQRDTVVQMAGAGSGIKTGKVLRVEEDGTIVTDVKPAAGDAGAPFLTVDHQLIGMLWGWSPNGRESFVAPIQPLLDDLHVQLVAGPP